MDAFLVMACVYALLLWWHARLTEERKRVVGCTHDHVKTIPLKDHAGRTWALHLRCRDCPWQSPARSLVKLPAPDLYWFIGDHEKFGPEHIEAIKEARRLDLSVRVRPDNDGRQEDGGE